jgi:hypothetical protein
MSHIGMVIPKSAKGFPSARILPELCPHLCSIADRKTPYMRAGLIIALLLLLTYPLFAQHIHGVPAVDTVAGRKDLVPFSITIPPHPIS